MKLYVCHIQKYPLKSFKSLRRESNKHSGVAINMKIARLEAEFEKARLESTLQHLQHSVEYYDYSDGSNNLLS
jgi:hypothetical protein